MQIKTLQPTQMWRILYSFSQFTTSTLKWMQLPEKVIHMQRMWIIGNVTDWEQIYISDHYYGKIPEFDFLGTDKSNSWKKMIFVRQQQNIIYTDLPFRKTYIKLETPITSNIIVLCRTWNIISICVFHYIRVVW